MRIARVLACVGALTIALSATALAQGNKGKIAIIPQGGLTLPIGDFADTDTVFTKSGYATAAFAAGATVEYFVTDNIAVGGSFQYNRFGFDEEVPLEVFPAVFADLLQPGMTLDISALDANWTVVDFGAFVKYYFMPEKVTQPFGRVGFIMGKPKMKGDITGELTTPLGTTTITEGEGEIDMTLGLELGGGVVHEVKENISLFGEVSFTNQFTDGKDLDITMPELSSDPVTVEGEGNNQWFTFKAGVAFFFQP
jgi:hypothetical protein